MILIDGKKAAAELREELKKEVSELNSKYNKVPGLTVILIGDLTPSQIYVRNKEKSASEVGLKSEVIKYPDSIDEKTVLNKIEELNSDDSVSGILVQLPLPKHINKQKVIEAIVPEKDVDGFHPMNVGNLSSGYESSVPCTPLGCYLLIKKIEPDLSGKKEKRLISSGLSETKTFGILSQHSEEWNMKLLRRCVTAGWVSFMGGDRPLAVLTEDGILVMKGERPGHLLLPPLASHGHIHRNETPEERQGRRSERLAAGTLQGDAVDLFEALREYRLDQAKSQGVPPYVVASDRTLRDLAMLKPRNTDELKLAHGIGPAKAERYGEGFLSVIQRFLSN